MLIKNIELQNFKSFQELKIDLNNLNILIGSNASGKSNFIRVLKFLRNIVYYNLADAISIEGGVEYVRNVQLGNSQDLYIKITYDPQMRRVIEKSENGLIGVKQVEASYEFQIQFHKRGKGFNITRDHLAIHYEFVSLNESGKNFEEIKKIAQGVIHYTVSNSKLTISENLPKEILVAHEEVSPILGAQFPPINKLPAKTLFLETPFFILAHGLLLGNPFADMAIYDFDPKLSQKAVSVKGKNELEEDGSNLSLVLKNILANKESARQFVNLTTDMLPFADSFRVQQLADKSLLLALRERYTSSFLPAFLLSDGTVNITALIVALYFEEHPLVVLEEPERTVHPSLIAKLVDLLTDVSSKKQIIVTTHNPEIVKHARLQDLLLVSRVADGFSTICRPAERQNVQTFLENEIGVQDLYVQDLLGV